MIWNGSTPTVVFCFDLSWDETDELIVTFSQGGKTVLELDKSRFAYIDDDDGYIRAQLTQSETLKFSHGFASVQIKAKMDSGAVSHSNIVRYRIEQALNTEVI